MKTDMKFLIIDTRKCIDCGNCEISCERRHKAKRFDRRGFEVGYVRIPTSCKNCVDPECMNACKFKAMIKTDKRLTQPMELCVGCSLCSRKCPFGAIKMLNPEELQKNSAEQHSGLFHFFRHKQDEHDKQTVPLELDKNGKKKKNKKEVWKCDSCADYKYRGCVYNCATGALQEIVLEEFVKTIPVKWAQKLVEYLSPAFLTAEEKALIRSGDKRLVVDDKGEILLLDAAMEEDKRVA